MKKFLIPLVALAAFVMMACSGGAAEDAFKTATDKIESAANVEDVKAAVADFAAAVGKMEKADLEKISESTGDKLTTALEKKLEELKASDSDKMEIGFSLLGALMQASGGDLDALGE